MSCDGMLANFLQQEEEAQRQPKGAKKDVPLESAGDEVLRRAKDSSKGAQRKPKGAKRRQKEAQGQPKRAKREAKGSPGGGKTAPKTIKNRSCIWKAFFSQKRCHHNSLFDGFWSHFGSQIRRFFVLFFGFVF